MKAVIDFYSEALENYSCLPQEAFQRVVQCCFVNRLQLCHLFCGCFFFNFLEKLLYKIDFFSIFLISVSSSMRPWAPRSKLGQGRLSCYCFCLVNLLQVFSLDVLASSSLVSCRRSFPVTLSRDFLKKWSVEAHFLFLILSCILSPCVLYISYEELCRSQPFGSPHVV